MNEHAKTKDPIVNCHTHIFTGDHVPPWLAKTVVPWPFFYFLPLSALVRLFRWWYKYPGTIPYTNWYKRRSKGYASFQSFLNRAGFIRKALEIYIALQVFYILYYFIQPVFPPDKSMVSTWIASFGIWCVDHYLLWHITSALLKIFIILLVAVFLPTGRNLIISIFKLLWGVIRKLPGKQTTAVFKRYLNIGRFAFHKNQGTILSQLRSQYPVNSKIVVLPMDMEYLDAGKPATRYRDQMEKLAGLKSNPENHDILLPFICGDPNRMEGKAKEGRTLPGEKIYFDYRAEEGKVILEDSFMKDYLEIKKFSGIKIYPAMGYYPFDARLLALWKYTADNGIPIMTHCVRGPMYFRGKKKPEWNQHPFFDQAIGRAAKLNSTGETTSVNSKKDPEEETMYEPLALPQSKNNVFSANFTHPLNFICLLEEVLLRKVVAKAIGNTKDQRLATIFGYTDENTPLKHDLRHLKVCLGHYGGGDEWARYFEKDRYVSSNLFTHTSTGLDFLNGKDGKFSHGKIEQIWNYTDWYTIISSMMLQHPNVYADISYILHADQDILPLLKQSLGIHGLQNKILFGTDFYVVRNYKSDKEMLADMMAGLTEDEFDMIARKNPKAFLNLYAKK